MIDRHALMVRAQELLGFPFEYGQTDCAMICILLLDAMTGSQHADQYRGQWHDRKSALRALSRKGSLQTGLEALGCLPIAPGFQQVGDFILAEDAAGWIYSHVCLGERSISSSPEDGVCLVDTAAALACGRTMLIRRIG